jgi:hypothetical protein
LHTGNYTTKNGSQANFINGTYTLSGGKTGNLFNPSSKLNTATLTIPAQWTSSGVGSAIPVTALGHGITVVYTITGPTTVSPLTVYPTTIPARTISGIVSVATTIAGTTIEGLTFTDATTFTSTSTMMMMGGSASASVTKKQSGALPAWNKGLALILVVLGFWLGYVVS